MTTNKRELSDVFNVDTATINHIARGRSWKHVEV